MTRVRLLTYALACWAAGVFLAPGAQAQPPCGGGADWKDATIGCTLSPDEARSRIEQGSTGPAPTHRYRIERACVATTESQGPDCTHQPCSQVEDGHYYALFESPIAADPPVWALVGYVCLNNPDDLFGPSEEEILRAFQRLSWPAATLAVEPADGETLVNLPTAFHTPDDQPHTQTVTLLGQTIVIEATPIQWTWHWAQPDDGASPTDTTPHTTSHPGAPQPNASITHAYRVGDLTVHPSVDVTYQGRYRLNNGRWQDIPDTHTVAGPATQPLTVLEARPALVR